MGIKAHTAPLLVGVLAAEKRRLLLYHVRQATATPAPQPASNRQALVPGRPGDETVQPARCHSAWGSPKKRNRL